MAEIREERFENGAGHKATKNKPGLTYALAILPLESFLESPGSRKRTADKSRNPGCPQRPQVECMKILRRQPVPHLTWSVTPL